MNIITVALIFAVVIIIFLSIYIYFSVIVDNIKYKEESVHEFMGIASEYTAGAKMDVSNAEYMTYSGLWDKSVKTYKDCTFIPTQSPYYDFFVYECERGGAVVLRAKKE